MQQSRLFAANMKDSRKWIYWGELFHSKFQAGCLAKRMEEDWWIYGYDSPQRVEIYETRNGRYGVRYMW